MKKTFFLVFIFSFLSSTSWGLRAKQGQVFLDKIEDYDQCQTMDYGGNFCQDALNRWVQDHPQDTLKAAKLTRLKMNHFVAVPLFQKALELKQTNCQDEDLKLAVLSGLDQSKETASDIFNPAYDIGFKKCGKDLKQPIIEAAKLDSVMFKNVCKDLDAMGALSGLKKKKCQ